MGLEQPNFEYDTATYRSFWLSLPPLAAGFCLYPLGHFPIGKESSPLQVVCSVVFLDARIHQDVAATDVAVKAANLRVDSGVVVR